MTEKKIKNIAASVMQKLLNKARETKRSFEELLLFYTMERFLYRLSKSKYNNKFILKGALLLFSWEISKPRATRDIDLLCDNIKNSLDVLINIFQEICSVNVENDGFDYLTNDITAIRINEDADYKGVRILIPTKLGRAKVKVQIDIGFADIIYPEPVQIFYPVILDNKTPTLLGYSKESVIAEKFEAMVKLGIMNSRMKDFYDIWKLSKIYTFDLQVLIKAITVTFNNRNTELISDPVCFTDEFINDKNKQIQWKAFINRTNIEDAPVNFKDVVTEVNNFLKYAIMEKV